MGIAVTAENVLAVIQQQDAQFLPIPPQFFVPVGKKIRQGGRHFHTRRPTSNDGGCEKSLPFGRVRSRPGPFQTIPQMTLQALALIPAAKREGMIFSAIGMAVALHTPHRKDEMLIPIGSPRLRDDGLAGQVDVRDPVLDEVDVAAFQQTLVGGADGVFRQFTAEQFVEQRFEAELLLGIDQNNGMKMVMTPKVEGCEQAREARPHDDKRRLNHQPSYQAATEAEPHSFNSLQCQAIH